MCNFKVGDKVKVIHGGLYLIAGSIFTLNKIYIDHGVPFVELLEDNGCERISWNIYRFVKYEEKEKTLKVEMNKKYRMVGTHEPVRVVCTDRADPRFTCVGLYPTGEIETPFCFDSKGKDQYGRQIIEEVPAVDWGKVKVDTPIWIKFSTAGTWHKRHFQGADGAGVYFWPDGKTSFTCDFSRWIAPSVNCVAFDNCSLEEPK